MSVVREPSVSRSMSPKLVKKIEKEILTEAKNEEKRLKNAIEDLTQIEKAENKAQKEIAKADKCLEKAETREQHTLKDQYQAEHNHGIALSNVRKSQRELEAATKVHAKMAESLRNKADSVEQAMQERDAHAVTRNAKLEGLREQTQAGQPLPNTASQAPPARIGN